MLNLSNGLRMDFSRILCRFSRKSPHISPSTLPNFLILTLLSLSSTTVHLVSSQDYNTFDTDAGHHGGSSGGSGGSSECALLLEGPGRTSSFDYNLNSLRGSPNQYAGPAHTCITYDAVNNAYIQARKYIRVAERRERYSHEELATVGELVLEVSRILARTYGLSVDEIEHGLPLIDTSKTLVREVCPAFLSNVHCQPGKYRRYDGLCNNLKHPTWGAVQSQFARLLKPVYSDAISDPRVGHHGSTLPPPRIVSRTIHPDEGYHDHAATILLISWGQFMDHDLTLTATPLDPVTRNEPEECCHRAPNARNPYCMEISIPHDDPFYGVYGVRCIDFVRGFPGVRAGCRLGSRNQFNILTAVIDGNTVYGVEENFARSLRSGYGGLLRMNPVFAQYGLHDLLPLKLDIPDEGCTRPNRSMYCFDAGEIRVNEQLVLTCMHTLMAREHNRVAHKLGEVNPHWDDETLYQESRRVVIAEIQHITYNEFLPLVLGKEVMAKFGLLLQKEGFWDGYDPNVNPGVLASFSAAAFRFGHSLLPTNVERWSKAHKFIASRRLRDLIRQPFDLYRAGVIDEYFMGMANQVAQAMDDSVTQEVTNHLFRKPGQPFGVDLAAFNMARGREFGLPSYMEYRKYCGLPGATGWDDLFGSMNNITVKRYSQIYVHPQDIDLWSGGVSERPLPGAMVGPTFACIIASQFSNARRGDRFWYELGGHPHSFTLEQLAELRKSRLARVVCDNTDIIDTIQLYPMVLPDHEINPRVPCRSGVLLQIDFSKWADYGHSGAHSQPIASHLDTPSLGGYENDPSIGKYVNQDGLQQLRHYLKVGPYRDYLGKGKGGGDNSYANPFFGYLRQVLTRRPVHFIDSTSGQDLSSVADVHYSPGPEHEPEPYTPVVDYNKIGHPVHPPGHHKLSGFSSPLAGGRPSHYSKGMKYNLNSNHNNYKQQAYVGPGQGHRLLSSSISQSTYQSNPAGLGDKFVPVIKNTNTNNHFPSNFGSSLHHHKPEVPSQTFTLATSATKYKFPPYAPPTTPQPIYDKPPIWSTSSSSSSLTAPRSLGQRTYGTPALPFGSGPLALAYGFTPVQSPYGNVSHPTQSNYASSTNSLLSPQQQSLMDMYNYNKYYQQSRQQQSTSFSEPSGSIASLYDKRYASEIPEHVLKALHELYQRNNYKRKRRQDESTSTSTIVAEKESQTESKDSKVSRAKRQVTTVDNNEGNSKRLKKSNGGSGPPITINPDHPLIRQTFGLMHTLVDITHGLLTEVKTQLNQFMGTTSSNSPPSTNNNKPTSHENSQQQPILMKFVPLEKSSTTTSTP